MMFMGGASQVEQHHVDTMLLVAYHLATGNMT